MDTELIATGAREILAGRGWCVVEACTDIPTQQWEARLLVFGENVDAVIEAVAEEIECDPSVDLRLTGCCRKTLAPQAELGAYLCYVAPSARGGAGVPDEPFECRDDRTYRADRRSHHKP